MLHLTEATYDEAVITVLMAPKGVSTESTTLSKRGIQIVEDFYGSSEILRDYSPTFGIYTVAQINTLNEALQKVRQLLTWQTNWNGYESPSPTYSAIAYAKYWIKRLFFQVASTNWISPNVTVGPEGEVVFEWWNEQKKLTIYVSGDNAEYVQVWGPDIYADMSDGNAEPIDVCKALWMWLYS